MIHVFAADGTNTLTEVTQYVDLGKPGAISVTENAEETSVGSCSVVFDDQNGDLELVGLRDIVITEDLADFEVIWRGQFAERRISRGDYRDGPLARTWAADIEDLNTRLAWRIFNNTDANRPAETDVERMQWLITTLAITDVCQDVTTYFDTSDPVDMDAVDYQGQYMTDLLNNVMQLAKKNCYLLNVDDGMGGYQVALWYGKPELTTFSSSLQISNVLDDIDFATVWPPYLDAEMARSPSRVYSEERLNFDGGHYGDTRSATYARFFATRATIADDINIKSTPVATVRVAADLTDMASEDDTFTCTVIVPPENVNDVRAGMRMQAKFSHFAFPAGSPSYDDFTWFRVLSRTVTFITPEEYEVQLKLTPQEDGPFNPCAAVATPAGFYPPICVSGTIVGVTAISAANGVIVYQKPGDGYPSGTPDPQPSFSGGWHFANYNQSSSFSPSGKQDYWGTLASNSTYIAIGGDGHIAIYATDFDSAVNGQADLYDYVSGSLSLVSTVNWTTPNTLVEFDLTGASDGICQHMIILHDGPGNPGAKIGFGGFDWTPV